MAVPLLVLAGAAAVQVEIVATAYVQGAAPDRLRASVLGLTDTAMVAAALVGALVAPVLAGALGPRVVVLIAAAGSVAAVAMVRRPVVRPATVGEPQPASV
jgi:MFS family permease